MTSIPLRCDERCSSIFLALRNFSFEWSRGDQQDGCRRSDPAG